MPDILLSTLNARYAHAAFGLRYLLANFGELQSRAAIAEFDISQRPIDIAEAILARQPRILGLGVYIWNIGPMTELVGILKRAAPRLIIVLGGPEVSHEVDQQEIVRKADYTITGEADLEFPKLCGQLLQGRRPLMPIIQADPPSFSDLKLPYALYDEKDVAHRVIYVEASRGCPFSCEFCLSSLDVPVRNAPLEPFLASMDDLLKRGVKQFKFVDRTFNLNANIGRSILQFFLDRYHPGLFVHFEMIPDRLPEALRALIRQFPEGALQFEVGIQSFNPDVQALISRRQNNDKTEENLRWLRSETNVHIHADLIVGLPGETEESFAAGFDRLAAIRPQEIQVGMLKRLRGTPIVRHDAAWEMVYSPQAPYEVLSTKSIDFAAMCRMRRFARYWDLIANSGRFPHGLPMLLAGASAFERFMALSEWLWKTTRSTHGIALVRLFELLLAFAKEQVAMDVNGFGRALWRDYRRDGRTDKPSFLAGIDLQEPTRETPLVKIGAERQSRHRLVKVETRPVS
ncbi:MAG: B12-binding domain-containing radical SAM protein [Planctomycetes bacterium]|nr:B12-binding domain-containing radical SAM protein [Planctomycetota bacterium]